MGSDPRETFVGEPIEPAREAMDAGAAPTGGPALPRRFRWRGKEYEIGEVLETWRETGPCTHGSGERYVRKHWFRVRAATGEEMKLYFERRARSARDRAKRWWLYTVVFDAQAGGRRPS